MERIPWRAAVLVCLVANVAGAQTEGAAEREDEGTVTETSPSGRPWLKNAITASPLGLLFGNVGLEYERALSPSVSALLAPSAKWGKGLLALGVDAGVHVYPGREAVRGFWVGPEGGISKTSLTTYLDGAPVGTVSFVAWSLRGMLGYSWLIGDLVDVSVGAGVAYNSTRIADSSGGLVTLNIPFPAFRANLGFAF